MPRKLMPVHEALMMAADRGIDADITCAVRQSSEEFYVAVTTDDRDPLIAIRRPSTGRAIGERLLSDRQQFGPDSWEYTARLDSHPESFFIRLTKHDLAVELPILPAALAVLSEHGFAATEDSRAFAVVDSAAFSDAIAQLD